jgi:hypothetical protein
VRKIFQHDQLAALWGIRYEGRHFGRKIKMSPFFGYLLPNLGNDAIEIRNCRYYALRIKHIRQQSLQLKRIPPYAKI